MQLYQDTTEVLESFSLLTLPFLAHGFLLHASKTVLYFKGLQYYLRSKQEGGERRKG